MEKPEIIPGLHDLYHSCRFYWGNIDRIEAERILKEKPNGSYLLKDRIREAHETTLESLGDNTEIIWYSDKEEGIYHSDQKFLLEFAYKFNSSIYYAIYTEDLYNQQCKEAIESRGGIWCPKQNGGIAYFGNCTSRTEFLVRFGIHAAVNYDENQDDDQDEYDDLHVRNKIYHSNCKLRIEFAAKCTIPVVRRNVFSLKELTKTAVLNKNYEITYENITSLGIPIDLQNYLRESLPKPELIPGVYDLYNSCKFYWGNIDRKEAELILKDEPEGSFLLKVRTREIHEKNHSKNINDLGENTIILYFHIYKKTFDTFEINHSYRNFLLEFAYKPDDFSIEYAVITEDLYQRYVHQINNFDRDRYGYESDEAESIFLQSSLELWISLLKDW